MCLDAMRDFVRVGYLGITDRLNLVPIMRGQQVLQTKSTGMLPKISGHVTDAQWSLRIAVIVVRLNEPPERLSVLPAPAEVFLIDHRAVIAWMVVEGLQ